MTRRKVPNVTKTRSKISLDNIKNDKMSDIKKHYGWSERQLESHVRGAVGSQESKETLDTVYKEAYKRKD